MAWHFFTWSVYYCGEKKRHVPITAVQVFQQNTTIYVQVYCCESRWGSMAWQGVREFPFKSQNHVRPCEACARLNRWSLTKIRHRGAQIWCRFSLAIEPCQALSGWFVCINTSLSWEAVICEISCVGLKWSENTCSLGQEKLSWSMELYSSQWEAHADSPALSN